MRRRMQVFPLACAGRPLPRDRKARTSGHGLAVLVTALVVLAGSGGPLAAQPDFVDLRERLEVARETLRDAMPAALRAPDAEAFPTEAPGKVFRRYLERALEVSEAAEAAPEVHAALRGYRGRLNANDPVARAGLGVFLGDYMMARYEDDVVRELRTLVGFKTYNNIIEPNAENPEFARAFAFLADLATRLGLEARNHNNVALEITWVPRGVDAGTPPLVMYTDIDVMRPVEYKWDRTTRPFDLTSVEDRWIGLGAYAKKGATILNLFALRALRDSGLELQRPVTLLVGSSANDIDSSVRRALERLAVRPALVLAADGVFPYSTGELGERIARVASRRGMKSMAGIGPETFYVYKATTWASTNTVPAETRIWVLYTDPVESSNPSLDMLNKWRAVVEGYQREHPVTRYGTYVQEDTLHFFTYGQPALVEFDGRNTLMDAASPLMRLPFYENSAYEILRFIDEALQHDPTGKAAGVYFEHPTMGTTRVQPVQLDRIGEEVSVLIDIRWPPGHDAAWIATRMQAVVDRFNARHGAALELSWEPGGREPAQIEPPEEITALLVDAFELASADFEPPPSPLSHSSGSLLPDAIPFGPDWPQVPKRGHTRHEYITPREMRDLAVAWVSALAWLGAGALPTTP